MITGIVSWALVPLLNRVAAARDDTRVREIEAMISEKQRSLEIVLVLIAGIDSRLHGNPRDISLAEVAAVGDHIRDRRRLQAEIRVLKRARRDATIAAFRGRPWPIVPPS